MSESLEDRFAQRLVSRLGREPEVSVDVAARLAFARHQAVSRAAASRQAPVTLGNVLAWQFVPAQFRRILMWVGLVVTLAVCATTSSHVVQEPHYGWHADADDSSYAELVAQ